MAIRTMKATYRNGLLKLSQKLPLPNNATVILTWRRPADPIEATQGIIRVPRKVTLELTTPHKYNLWDL